MRSLFLILLLANLLFAAAQFDVFGPLLHPQGTRIETIQPEKLRLVDNAARPATAAPTKRAPAAAPPNASINAPAAAPPNNPPTAPPASTE